MDGGRQEPPDINLAYAEQLFAQYQEDPGSVPEDWRAYFDSFMPLAPGSGRLGPSFTPASVFHPTRDQCRACAVLRQEVDVAVRQDRVDQLFRAYRVRGHLIAQLDPLGLPRPPHPELEPEFYELTETDLDRVVSSRSLFGAPPLVTLREALERLKNTYCRSIGVQFMHIDDVRPKLWLEERMESVENRIHLSRAEQLRLLTRLTDAVIFEEFIHRKYLGAKRFSLEGAESLIPLLDMAIERAADRGVREIMIGMPHRGRLNVLANIVHKNPRLIFAEFDDKDPERQRGGGDVKYHLGHSGEWITAGGKRVGLSLCFNPSHLEYVNPVALGRTRARQDRSGDEDHSRGMTLLLHGDAAFAGQGIIQETLNMSHLPGYRVGGTLHLVVNNQIGFTTSPEEYRSSDYATAVAKMLQIPIFHVNGENPEAVAQVIAVAVDFRAEFHRDVVIDMYCYRRYGHNEGDEPAFTQPQLYQAIQRRKSVREGYLEHLLALGEITREEAESIARERRESLERELSWARDPAYHPAPEAVHGTWAGYAGGPDERIAEPKTGLAESQLSEWLRRLAVLPAGFHPHSKIERFLAARRGMAAGERPLDWSAAEALAFGSLAATGHRVRLSGQDSQRGTFSHRHAVLHDVENGRSYFPLQQLTAGQAPVEIINSPLSESGVLGFEYGYSLECPDALVAWEAQFGDFCNVAQVIIDQFLVSGEDKWKRLSGLVLLLPHGFEGQGPEHSSARLERFLNLCAEDNIQVTQPTTPAQLFHLLRRQVLRRWRKPLVVMTPKSLLRHPRVVSSLSELAEGLFMRIVPDSLRRPASQVKRVLLCSGKVYYDLEKVREDQARQEVAIVRIEQLYPLAEAELARNLMPYPQGTPIIWVQDEPENMGAWSYMKSRFAPVLSRIGPFSVICRPLSASPATGSAGAHRLEQQEILERAFAAPGEAVSS